jgi:hypothetical protein
MPLFDRVPRSDRLQRGSTNWPFVIVLLALLAFVYMWWTAQENKDSQDQKIADLEKSRAALVAVAQSRGELLAAHARILGWTEQLMDQGSTGLDPTLQSNLATVAEHLKPDGRITAEGGETLGAMAQILQDARITIPTSMRSSDGTAESSPLKLQNLSDELKAQIEKIQGMEVPARPQLPADADDTEAQAEYQNKLAEYTTAVEAFRAEIETAVNMDGWSEVEQEFRTQYGLSVDAETMVTLAFGVPLAEQTVQGFMRAVRGIPKMIVDEFAIEKKTDVAERTRLMAQLAEKETKIGELNESLRTQQDTYGTDMAQKESTIEELRGQVADRDTKLNAVQQQLETEKTEFQNTQAKTMAELNAQREANRLEKQRFEIKKARDDDDGIVLAANPSLGIANISLGHADKVQVGMPFQVSALDRVGARVAKGTIMVTKVTGDHSARARIVSGSAGSGDVIHNPLFDKSDKIYVFFAGPMEKWPAGMAKGRLASKGVILQSAVDGNTNYIVVPNSWTVAAAMADSASEGEDEEADSGAKSPIEKLEQVARNVGARVLPERLFDSFLNY